MQQETMESHQQLLSSRPAAAQSEPSLARSSSFPQQSSSFLAQQAPVVGKQNYQAYSSGRRYRGEPPKPGLRGGPQKVSKTNKKDGKPKGQAGNGRNLQTHHEVTQDREYELELNLAQGRKVSLNHLLNFTFERRGEQQPTRGGRKYSGQGQHHHHHPMRLPKYNKDQFLQATCQFVVKHDADYSVYLADPDLLVDWTLIEQIRLRGPEVGSCPICLHPPVAAKMTRCGHVYCWPCVLHYLALSDRAWRACPVCSDPIYRKDLKSVISIPQKQYQIGEEIEFRLMRRERDSLLPHFVSQPPAEELGNIRNERGQKLVLASPTDVAEFVLRREKVELDTQYEVEKEQPEACFILEALTLLRDRENQQAASYEEVDPASEISLSDIGKEQLDDSLLGDEGDHDESGDRSRYDSVSSDQLTDHSKDEVSGTGTVTSIGPEDLEFHESESEKSDLPETSSGPKKDVFYFYQAADGQNIYLHGLNAQMLIHEYGSLERSPRIVRGTIIERDSMTMSLDVRNRLRYLRHLPVTTNFEVIEIDLGVPIVSKKTVVFFHDRLAERERRRRRKDRDERRRERRIQIEEEAKMGRFPKLNVKLDSSLHFPECSRDNYHPGSEPDPVLVPENVVEDHVFDSPLSASPSTAAWGAATSSSGGMSFAQTLRTGKLKPSPSWPVVKRDPVSVHPKPKVFDPDDEEPSGVGREYQAPAAMSFSAALTAALDQAAKEGSSRVSMEAATGNGAKKKKNKSKKLLFSTGL